MAAERWDADVDAHIAKLNARVGESGPAPLFPDGPYAFPIHQSQVTADMIRLFARSNGDRNPLWRDEGYAQKTRWGGLIAPPILEAALSESPSMPNPPQIRGWNVLQGGFHRRYLRPFRPGDIVHGEDTWLGYKEKSQPGRPYRLFIQSCERAYIDQNDEVICRVIGRMASTAARPVEGDDELRVGPDWTNRVRRRLSAEELEEIQRGYNVEIGGENCRGAKPRYWEDVHVGDEIPAMVKGPYDISDAVAFAGVLNLCAGFAAKWEAMRPDLGRHPPDSETGAPRHAIDWHLEDAIGRQHGLPYAHAFGTHMEMMMVHPVTNWMGDAAAIVEIDTQLRSILLMGEVSRTTAHVAAKREEEGRHLVEIAVASHVQTGVGENGVRYGQGTVIVELPSVTAAK
jgi:acyl dehydratase